MKRKTIALVDESFGGGTAQRIIELCQKLGVRPEEILTPLTAKDRELIIRRLRKWRATEEEIGTCFGMTRQGVSFILRGLTGVVHFIRGRPWDLTLQQVSRLRREEVVAAMERAAFDESFWGEGGVLLVSHLLGELGLRVCPDSTGQARAWRLVRQRFGLKSCKVWIVIRFGLGKKDPVEYLRLLYYIDGLSLSEIAREINAAGTVTIGASTLYKYMTEVCHFTLRGRGPRGRTARAIHP